MQPEISMHDTIKSEEVLALYWEYNGVFEIEQGIHFIIILSKERFYGAGYCEPQGH